MSDLKNHLKELGSVTAKIFGDIKESISNLIENYQNTKAESGSKTSGEKPTASAASKPKKPAAKSTSSTKK